MGLITCLVDRPRTHVSASSPTSICFQTRRRCGFYFLIRRNGRYAGNDSFSRSSEFSEFSRNIFITVEMCYYSNIGITN